MCDLERNGTARLKTLMTGVARALQTGYSVYAHTWAVFRGCGTPLTRSRRDPELGSGSIPIGSRRDPERTTDIFGIKSGPCEL